jgi:2-keto-4-pentenoate hydratase/2-oxohepta-3-ene-1,7-dioic acid hydratase in catechol pathway
MDFHFATPSKIVCVGRNYVDHAKELGNDVPKEPLLFLKPPTSLIGPGETIVLPPQSKQVEHEAEIGVVMGKRLSHADAAQAEQAIEGFVCLNDVTARDLQRSDGQWTRAKGFDTFCAVGPRLAKGLNWKDLEVVGRVNGVERQRGNAGQMVFSIPAILSYISGIMTLLPGDLIATGTPAGVGPLAPGDIVEVEVTGVGVLSNPVKAFRGNGSA